MKKITVLLFCALMFVTSGLFAQSGPTAAGSLEFGIGKLFSYDRLWNEDFTVNRFNLGTFGNGNMMPLGEAGLYLPSPYFTG